MRFIRIDVSRVDDAGALDFNPSQIISPLHARDQRSRPRTNGVNRICKPPAPCYPLIGADSISVRFLDLTALIYDPKGIRIVC